MSMGTAAGHAQFVPSGATDVGPRIVVVVDGGPGSAAALRWAAAHVGTHRDRVVIMTVVPEGVGIESGRLTAAERVLSDAATVIRTMNPQARVVTSLREGHPIDEILDEDRADLIVLGTSAEHGSVLFGFGSLPAEVAVRAEVPVVVVPAHWDPVDGPVVAGVGPDIAAEEAADVAARLADRAQAELVLVHVREAGDESDSDEGTRDRLLADMAAALRADGVRRVRQEARHGDVVAALRAESASASALVVGRRRRSRITEALLGSAARELLTAPGCPLVVVPAPRRPIR